MSSDSPSNSSKLNPSASEFVPKFTAPAPSLNAGAASTYTNGHSAPQYHQKYNNSNGRHNNNNSNYYQSNQNSIYRGNSGYYNNNNNSNYYQNNNYHSNSNGGYNQYNQNNDFNDLDPIEIEARCEAVIEILQDENVREHLNPQSKFPAAVDSTPSYGPGSGRRGFYDQDQQDNGGIEDEEEMLEMMAMQEECRLEMMKFYIQSQNPSLFEEIYHDVSYPDMEKRPAATFLAAETPATNPSTYSSTTPSTNTNTYNGTDETYSASSSTSSSSATEGDKNAENTVLDSISGLSLNDEKKQES